MTKYINKIALTVAIIVLFIPTIVAFIYLNSANDGPAIPANAKIYINIASGNDREDVTDEDLIDMITSDINTAKAYTDISGLPLYDGEAYLMTVTAEYSPTRRPVKTYTCYFNSDASQCYFKNESGSVFSFSSRTAEEVLKLSICNTVIPYSAAPAVYYEPERGAKTKLEPVSTNWTYLNKREEAINSFSTDSSAAKLDITYLKNTAFSEMLSFDSIIGKDGASYSPAAVYVTATAQNDSFEKVLIEGFDQLIAGKNYMDDTSLTLTVEVIWGDEAMTQGFFGSQSFVLNVLYDVPATFTLSDSALSVGNLPLIKAVNLNKGETPAVTIVNTTTGETMDYAPYFVDYNNMSIAFVPFTCTRTPGNYSITVSTADVSTELKINIKSKSYTSKKISVAPQIVSNSYGENTIAAFTYTMEDVFAIKDDVKHWEGKFTAPISSASKPTQYIEYGQKITVNAETPVQAMCNVYTAAKDTAVFAANSGRVIYAGELALTGKLVVIEHGFGYKTWYWNMGSVNVSVGDTVAKGAKIGTIGSTGFCNGTKDQLSYATSIGSEFFSPDLYMRYEMDYFDAD